MIYQYRIFLDFGYDGVDWEVMFSDKQIEGKELKRIVQDAYEDPNRETKPHQGTCSSVIEHIIKTHPDFFDLEMGGSIMIND
jgi:hypothetical protein